MEVGDTVTFTATVRDSAGQVVVVPAIVWTAGNTAVGLILGGIAVGKSPGSTSITASVGSVSSAPAVLTVTAAPGPCDGIEMAPSLQASLEFVYLNSLTNGDNDELKVEHSGTFNAILLPVGGVLPTTNFTGILTGAVLMNDRNRHLSQNPVQVETLVGTALVADEARSRFALNVDTSNCTFAFTLNPWVHVTSTATRSGMAPLVQTGDLGLGVLQGSGSLGQWRAFGMTAVSSPFNAHSILAPNPGLLDRYYPFGMGQLLWSNNGSMDISRGYAEVTYNIR